MAQNISKKTIKFLKDVRDNNNRPWFEKNKPRFEEAKADIKSFSETLLAEIEKFDEIDGQKLYRIYRDVRFSKDKTPYKSSLSGHYMRAGKFRRGGLYWHIEPGKTFIGGGFWQPNKEDLFRIRKEIEMDDKPLRKIIKSASFKKHFGMLEGDKLKTAPKGFDKEHHAIDLLRYKSFIVDKRYSDKEATDGNLAKEMAKSFKTMHPFLDYMSQVLTTNLNGEVV